MGLGLGLGLGLGVGSRAGSRARVRARAWDGLGLGAAAATARRGGCLATCATYSLWNSSVKAKGGSEWRPGTASQPYSLIMMSFRKERLDRV